MLFKIAGFPINNLRTNIFSSIFLRGNLFILCILITRSSCAQCTPRQHTKLYIYHIIIIQQFAYIASNATQFCFTADSILVVRFRIGTHTLRAPNPFRCISWANKAKHTHKAHFFVVVCASSSSTVIHMHTAYVLVVFYYVLLLLAESKSLSHSLLL